MPKAYFSVAKKIFPEATFRYCIDRGKCAGYKKNTIPIYLLPDA
jgi:hypothetical protein